MVGNVTRVGSSSSSRLSMKLESFEIKNHILRLTEATLNPSNWSQKLAYFPHGSKRKSSSSQSHAQPDNVELLGKSLRQRISRFTRFQTSLVSYSVGVLIALTGQVLITILADDSSTNLGLVIIAYFSLAATIAAAASGWMSEKLWESPALTAIQTCLYFSLIACLFTRLIMNPGLNLIFKILILRSVVLVPLLPIESPVISTITNIFGDAGLVIMMGYSIVNPSAVKHHDGSTRCHLPIWINAQNIPAILCYVTAFAMKTVQSLSVASLSRNLVKAIESITENFMIQLSVISRFKGLQSLSIRLVPSEYWESSPIQRAQIGQALPPSSSRGLAVNIGMDSSRAFLPLEHVRLVSGGVVGNGNLPSSRQAIAPLGSNRSSNGGSGSIRPGGIAKKHRKNLFNKKSPIPANSTSDALEKILNEVYYTRSSYMEYSSLDRDLVTERAIDAELNLIRDILDKKLKESVSLVFKEIWELVMDRLILKHNLLISFKLLNSDDDLEAKSTPKSMLTIYTIYSISEEYRYIFVKLHAVESDEKKLSNPKSLQSALDKVSEKERPQPRPDSFSPQNQSALQDTKKSDQLGTEEMAQMNPFLNSEEENEYLDTFKQQRVLDSQEDEVEDSRKNFNLKSGKTSSHEKNSSMKVQVHSIPNDFTPTQSPMMTNIIPVNPKNWVAKRKITLKPIPGAPAVQGPILGSPAGDNTTTSSLGINDEILAMVVHDMRAPLTCILGNLELFDLELRDIQNDELYNMLSPLIKSSIAASSLLETLISDILDSARIAKGIFSLCAERMDLKETIMECINTVELAAKSKQNTMTCEYFGSQFVVSDKPRIKQVILNFLSNSIKFTRQGNIRVIISENEYTMQLVVEDNGEGIKKENLGKLFEKFTSDRESRSNSKGIGLGLFICKSIIEKLGPKRIVVTSEPHVSTRICFEIYKDATNQIHEPPKVEMRNGSPRDKSKTMKASSPQQRIQSPYRGLTLRRRKSLDIFDLNNEGIEASRRLIEVKRRQTKSIYRSTVSSQLAFMNITSLRRIPTFNNDKSEEEVNEVQANFLNVMPENEASIICKECSDRKKQSERSEPHESSKYLLPVPEVQLVGDSSNTARGAGAYKWAKTKSVTTKVYNILFVEDDSNILEFYKAFTEQFAAKSGFLTLNVFEAEDLETARQIIRRETIDILVTDYNLPDGTGPELAKEIRARSAEDSNQFLVQNGSFAAPPRTVIVLASGEDIKHMQAASQTELKALFDEFLLKPIRKANWDNMISLCLEKLSKFYCSVPCPESTNNLEQPASAAKKKDEGALKGLQEQSASS